MSGSFSLRVSRLSPLFVWAYAGARDAVEGARHWQLWYLLGSSDMRRRYSRSRLGPAWIMLSSAILISTMGLVWSFLWKQPVADMLPFVAVSMIVWMLLSGIISEATTAMTANGHYLLNQYTPTSAILFSLLYRHGATFALNIVFPIFIVLFFAGGVTSRVLLIIPGLILLGVYCFWMAFVVSIICTRFRDLIQVVVSIIQVSMFVTPILWKPELLGAAAQQYVALNPFAVLVSVVRDPLLGRPIPTMYWIAASAFSFGGLILAMPFIGRFRRRLIYWL